MKKIKILALAGLLLGGCAHLNPGADPIIVRVEQTQTVATATLDTFLKIDDGARDFWKTNAPGLHAFAEHLREQRVVVNPATGLGETNRLWIEGLKSLDRVKLAYKQGRANSNALAAALAVVESTVAEAQQYITQTTTNH